MMYHQRGMKSNLKIVSYGFLICISFFLITYFSVQQRETGKIDKEEVIQKKVYEVHIADDLLWQAISSNGVASISIGSMHVEKQRFGGFSLGGFNQLVIHNLIVKLPPLNKENEKKGADFKKNKITEFKKLGRQLVKGYPKFSSLQIQDLAVFQLLSNGSITNTLRAKRGVLKSKKLLELNNYSFRDNQGIFHQGETLFLDLDSLTVRENKREYVLLGM